MASILVTGGAGYIGCVLVPKLLASHRVVVFDAMWYGAEGLRSIGSAAGLEVIKGDLRDAAAMADLLDGHDFDAVIHLAAVSNDPCSDLDEQLTRSVNLDATAHLMRAAKRRGIGRFINASSASVYGVRTEPDVTEDLPLAPLTLYARYKAETESILNDLVDRSFCGVSVRAATVCGFSPRLRLDLTINILSYQALTTGRIRVFGGAQLRPNIHIQDLTDFYARLVDLDLDRDRDRVQGRAFNLVTRNATVLELAEMVRRRVAPVPAIEIVPTDDHRSYHLSAARARSEFGFEPQRDLSLAIDELRSAFADGRIADPHHYVHRNVEVMKRHPERIRWSAGAEPPCG